MKGKLIRIKNDTAGLDHYLETEKNEIKISNKEGLVWKKKFSDKIMSVEHIAGNFNTIQDYFRIIFDKNQEVLYSTTGTLLKDANNKSSPYMYEEFRGIVLASYDVKPGFYMVTLENIGASNNNNNYEIFDGRGMCVYQGGKKYVTYKTRVFENELLQVKTRTNLKMKISIEEINNQQTIFIMGDSTLTNQSLPFWGWSQLLQAKKSDNVVINLATSGRSTKSFIEEGRFIEVTDKLTKNDIVILGFGHNDEKQNYYGTNSNEYIYNITKMKRLIESIGATVYVCSPIARRSFVDGVLVETHQPYLSKLLEMSDTNIIDTNKISKELINEYGVEGSKQLFVHSDLMKIYDNTHTSITGANAICDEVVKLLS